MMKSVFPLLVVLTLGGCASFHPKSAPAPKPAPKVSKLPKTTKVTKANAPKEGPKVTRAVFHLIHPLGVELILSNLDDQRSERVLVDKTLSQLEIEPGHWQVRGFIMDGKTYEAVNPDQQFVFNLKKHQPTYVGSWIFQCPKVGREHLGEMKKMTFFNRYPFSDEEGLCELVVGNAYADVNKVWVKLVKDKKSLKLGL